MEKKTLIHNNLLMFRRLLPEIPSTQMISGDGNFNEGGLSDFLNSVKFDKCDISYVVVAIMGPQSSGKSTLLNHLFHPNFKEMDALSGRLAASSSSSSSSSFSSSRSQTRRGVWIAKAHNMEPFTLVVDLEGPDGQERGEDHTAFEKQSALFALAVSDILLINIWCHDNGREHAANRPLLNTIFEGTIHLFSHRETTVLSPIKRKTTLLFVLRDHTESTLEILERQLRNDMETTWKSVSKPEAFEGTPLSEFFNVEVTALPNYELLEDEFKEKVAQLREIFSHSTSPGGIASGSRQGIVPASEFCFGAKKVWETIKHNQDLDLPPVKLVHPVYMMTLEHLRKEAIKTFENGLENNLSGGGGYGESIRKCRESCLRDFDRRCSDAAIEQAQWGASIMREELVRDIETHILLVRTEKMPHIVDQCRERVSAKIGKRLRALFVMGDENEKLEWAEVRRILATERDAAASALSLALVTFELHKATLTQMVDEIKCYARNLVESIFKKEANNNILALLKERFIVALQDCTNIDFEIRKCKLWQLDLKCLKLLSTMAVFRLDDTDDEVEKVLIYALRDIHDGGDPLASTTWEMVPAEVTLITPVQCQNIWEQFVGEMEASFAQAKAAKAKSQESKHWAPPDWVILGLAVFGGVAQFFHVLRVNNIDISVLVDEFVQQGIITFEEGMNTVKKYIQAGDEKIGEIIEKIEEALQKFYDFVGDIFSSKTVLPEE